MTPFPFRCAYRIWPVKSIKRETILSPFHKSPEAEAEGEKNDLLSDGLTSPEGRRTECDQPFSRQTCSSEVWLHHDHKRKKFLWNYSVTHSFTPLMVYPDQWLDSLLERKIALNSSRGRDVFQRVRKAKEIVIPFLKNTIFFYLGRCSPLLLSKDLDVPLLRLNFFKRAH